MEVDHHKDLHPFCLPTEKSEEEEEEAGWSCCQGLADVKEVEKEQRETGEAGTLGITIWTLHHNFCLIFMPFHFSKIVSL